MPAFREEGVIAATLKELTDRGYRVLVVDDGSGDQTADVAKAAGAKVLRHPINLGQGAALETGMAWLRQQGPAWVVHFDADGQHDADDIPRLVSSLKTFDIALGSRFLEGGEANGMPPGRAILLRLARLFHGFSTGLWLSDAHCGLRALGPKALANIRLQEPGMAHASELLVVIRQKSLSWCEVPVKVRYTSYSLSKGQQNSQAWRILGRLVAKRLL